MAIDVASNMAPIRRKPRSYCRQKCRRIYLCPPIQKLYSWVVCSSLRCWRQPMSRAKSCCHWLCHCSQAPAAAGVAIIGTVARPANTCGHNADRWAIRNYLWSGYGDFWPARTWAAKLPDGIPRLEDRLSFMRAPIDKLQLFLQQARISAGRDHHPTGPSRSEVPLF